MAACTSGASCSSAATADPICSAKEAGAGPTNNWGRPDTHAQPARRIFCVNWYRKNAAGEFLCPGFGESGTWEI
jgi:GTP-dependent phosphoenolpyruvate carboxykinase